MYNETKSGSGAQAGEYLDVFGAGMAVKCDASDLPLFLAEHFVPPGYLVPPHVHADEDELFYMLEGEITLMSPAGERVIRPGDCAKLPRGQVHGFRNAGTAEARFLVICLAGKQAIEMFRHLDRAGRAARGALAPEKIIGICAQYGVKMG